jgi:ribonuclease T1
MTKKNAKSPKRPRWHSLLGTGIALLVVLFIYLNTGTVPEGALEDILGTDASTVSAVLPQTDTPEPSPTKIAAAPATETPTDKATAPSPDTPTALSPATAQATATPTPSVTPAPARKPSATPTATQPPTRAPPTPTRIRSESGLPYILYADLPSQARDTIRLIDNGGPFPYRQDDATFQNREGILPAKPRGFYREYTVITPGSPDRGARRIIAGEDGVLFYTDDHYASFREVIR